MGKAKKKKFGAPKNQPTGLPSVGECEAELEMMNRPEATSATLQALVEKLQSPSVECRECACATLANLVSEPGAIPGLMKLNIVKILGPLVVDPSWDIRHRAIGALRNMSVDGGSDVCEKMVNADVLTSVLAFIKQFGKVEQTNEELKIKLKEVVYETYMNAFYLLLNLCESCQLAVSLINRENLIPVICSILESDKLGVDLKLAVVEFLYILSDDNPDLQKPELVSCLQKCVTVNDNSTESVLYRTFIIGVLVNLEGSRLTTAHGGLMVSIIDSLAEVLSYDITETIQAVMATTMNGAIENGAEGHENLESLRKSKLKDIQNVLQAQKITLEIVTNLSCSEDDEWEDLNESESSSSSDDAMETTDVAMETDNQIQTSLCVSTELHSAFVKSCIVSKVLQASQPLPDDLNKALKSVQGESDIISKYLRKQIHALLCLSNLVSALDVDAFGGVDRLHGVWQGLSQISVTQYCIESQELLEAVTNAMRAVIQKLTETDPSKFAEVKPSDLQFMVEMATKCQWSEVRVNALRVVAAIGTVLAQSQTIHSLLKDIGVLLLEVVCKDNDLWVKAEALDAIFDVFGEDHVDTVVKEISLIDKLKEVLPSLKAMIHSSKKKLGEHYPVISTAKTNLVRFIQYKSKQH